MAELPKGDAKAKRQRSFIHQMPAMIKAEPV